MKKTPVYSIVFLSFRHFVYRMYCFRGRLCIVYIRVPKCILVPFQDLPSAGRSPDLELFGSPNDPIITEGSPSLNCKPSFCFPTHLLSLLKLVRSFRLYLREGFRLAEGKEDKARFPDVTLVVLDFLQQNKIFNIIQFSVVIGVSVIVVEMSVVIPEQ